MLRGRLVSLTQLLTEFRQQIEREAGEPIENLELNTALLLSDLCRFLELSEENWQQVLGTRAILWRYLALPLTLLFPHIVQEVTRRDNGYPTN